MRRISLLVLILPAVLVAAGCGEYGKRYTGEGNAKAAASGTEEQVTDEKFDAAARLKDGCTELEEFESEGSTHTSDPDENVEYQHNPPHSGNHYEIALEWGRYDEPRDDEQWVHNLEHGHLVLAHEGLSDKQFDTLTDQATVNDYHLIVLPRKANPKPGVYYMAWTAQVYCKTPSAAALQFMIDNWRDQGPELFTDDAGGGDMSSES